tara:strand:- start:3167 stop:3610 length:444 start_codon:yes stop_codon:yes gene_type:complete
MAHLRKQLRDRAVADLTGLATTGSKIYASRVYPLTTANLPGLCVYTREESVEVTTINSPRTLIRELALIVEGYAASTTVLDDTLDQIALEVEKALAADITLNNLAKTIKLQSVDAEYSDEGEQPVGIIRLTYAVEYAALENNPEATN